MKDSAVRLREISRARDTLKLAPGLAAGVPISTDVAASEPAVIGAIRIGTEMSVRIDGAPSPSREAHEGRWRAGCRLRAWIGPLLTGLAEGFVDQSSEGFGFCGAFASVLVGFKGQRERGGWLVGPPDMNQETENEQSNQKELVK